MMGLVVSQQLEGLQFDTRDIEDPTGFSLWKTCFILQCIPIPVYILYTRGSWNSSGCETTNPIVPLPLGV
ncbi:unnamed protein product, partial [Staurois parvus]